MSLVGTISPATLRSDKDVVARVVCPLTLSVPEEVSPVVLALPAVIWPVKNEGPETERADDEALPSVVCPVTLSVEENEPVVPTRAP